MSDGLIALIGIVIVFIGLLALVGVCYLLGYFFGKVKVEEKKTVAPAKIIKEDDIDHNTLVAIITAAIAESTGSDMNGLRIHSIKKVN